MVVLIGFSTRIWIPALASSVERATWVEFGVQIIAASGRWGDAKRREMDG
jgi:hypothetical protein